MKTVQPPSKRPWQPALVRLPQPEKPHRILTQKTSLDKPPRNQDPARLLPSTVTKTVTTPEIPKAVDTHDTEEPLGKKLIRKIAQNKPGSKIQASDLTSRTFRADLHADLLDHKNAQSRRIFARNPNLSTYRVQLAKTPPENLKNVAPRGTNLLFGTHESPSAQLCYRLRALPEILKVALPKPNQPNMVRGNSQGQPLLRVFAKQDYDLIVVRDDAASEHLLPNPDLNKPLQLPKSLPACRHWKHNRDVDPLLPHQREHRESHRDYRILDDWQCHHQLPP